MLKLSEEESRSLDAELEKTLEWAHTRTTEAEQLAFDATRLLSCTEDRFDQLKNQSFFKRCWSRFSGKTGEIERANTNDLIQMQKLSFRYINLLQERDLLLGHAMLSIKNNLLSLAVKETETRNMIEELAKKTLSRFEKLESRVDQLEISVNVQGWLLTLEERNYTEKFPTSYLRLLRLVNDFYGHKRDNWNYQDLLFVRSALRKSQLIPEQSISMNDLIDGLVDEIYETDFNQYRNLLTQWKPESIENYSEFILDNISCQVGATLHGIVYQYVDQKEIVEALKDNLDISEKDALKTLLKTRIKKLGVDLTIQAPLSEIAFEILGCMRLAEKMTHGMNQELDSIQAQAPPLAQYIEKSEIVWDLLTNIPFNPKDVKTFAYGNNIWLLCTQANDETLFYASQDGNSWNLYSKCSSKINETYRPFLKYENSCWVMTDFDKIHYSFDGKIWKFVDFPSVVSSFSLHEATWKGLKNRLLYTGKIAEKASESFQRTLQLRDYLVNNIEFDESDIEYDEDDNYNNNEIQDINTKYSISAGADDGVSTFMQGDRLFFYENHWIAVAISEAIEFTYTKQEENSIETKAQDKLFTFTFFRNVSLDGPWEEWKDLRIMQDERIYIDWLFVSKKNLFAIFDYALGDEDAKFWELYNKKRYVSCFQPSQGWVKTLWPKEILPSLHCLLAYNNSYICLSSSDDWDSFVLSSNNGLEWKNIAEIRADNVLAFEGCLCLFSNWEKEKTYISADAENFHEIPWNSKGRIEQIKTDGRILLATICADNGETYMQIGKLKPPKV